MRHLFTFLVSGFAAGAPHSQRYLSTPLNRGGGKIIGGEDARYGEFPHLVELLRGGPGGSLMCGGSILSQDWVLTTGHCCDGMSASKLGVRAGNYHLYEEDEYQVDYAVKRVVLHKDYDSWTIENDICLLEINDHIRFNSHVMETFLPRSSEESKCGSLCWVIGWGTTSEGGSLSKILQKVQVPVVCDDECRDAYGQNDVTDSMMCAGKAGKDSCQGDSGGPLICRENEVTGMVSWGYGCAEPGYPGVYTQMSYFVDWVHSNMS